MKKIFTLIAISFFGMFTIASAQNYAKLSVLECYNLWMKEKSNINFVILDIRTADEYKAGHIANALQIDYYQTDAFYTYIEKLDKTKKYLIYCASAGRSGAAIAEFKKRNYNFADMTDLDGGLNNWKNKGYPTTTEITSNNSANFETNTLVLSPNPCKENFSVSTSENSFLQIIDFTGKIVWLQYCEQGIANVNTSFLPSGLYQVAIKTNNQLHTSKLIVE